MITSRINIPRFSPQVLGVNVNTRALSWFGLSLEKTLDTLFSLPGKRVRIPIPFDQVHPTKSIWDFTKTDIVIQKAREYKKIIDLQLGIKTLGYPEIHVPVFLQEQLTALLPSKEDSEENQKTA